MNRLLTLSLFLSLLIIGHGADFGQTGIIDSGTVEIPSFSSTPTTISLTFNIVYTSTPDFSFALTGFEMNPAQVYKILHTTNLQSSSASITWDMSESIRKVKIRYIASSGVPLRLKQIISTDVVNAVQTSVVYRFSVDGKHYFMKVKLTAMSPVTEVSIYAATTTATKIPSYVFQYYEKPKDEHLNIYLYFKEPPPLSTVIRFRLKRDLVSGPYEQLGYKDLTGADLDLALSSFTVKS